MERGFSVVALSGELSQNERTHALQALRDGRARICVATDVAARGIDLPGLDLVIHADLPNDPEVLQHRSGRTGRAGRKGVSVFLVPPSRRRRAEMMLQQAGIDAVWGTAPQAEEIRKLDQQRMMQDALFTEEPTDDDLTLARALLAERTPEAIASALARLYRARLPAPEDILDPGQDNFRDRFADRGNDRGRGRDSRPSRGDDNFSPAERSERKPRARQSLPGGSVWFRVSAGKQKKAEARWLLPMICRRGGVNKDEIGAIRIYEDHSEFEIAKDAVDKFTAKIQRPDKEQHVITALPNGPQGEGAPIKASPPPLRSQRLSRSLSQGLSRERLRLSSNHGQKKSRCLSTDRASRKSRILGRSRISTRNPTSTRKSRTTRRSATSGQNRVLKRSLISARRRITTTSRRPIARRAARTSLISPSRHSASTKTSRIFPSRLSARSTKARRKTRRRSIGPTR